MVDVQDENKTAKCI